MDHECDDRVKQIEIWLDSWEKSVIKNIPVAAALPVKWPTLPAGLLSEPGIVLDTLLSRFEAEEDGRSVRGIGSVQVKLVDIINYRQSRKWYVSIAVVGMFSLILALMIYFMSQGKDVTDGWKEILLLMLGGFVGSFAKVIDFWFNNQENDNKLLEHADD